MDKQRKTYIGMQVSQLGQLSVVTQMAYSGAFTEMDGMTPMMMIGMMGGMMGGAIPL